MATYLQTKAIVLGHRDLAEHDRLYTLYTESRGKLEVRVRGARKILSKLQPALTGVSVVRVLVYEGRSKPLLLGVEIIEQFTEVSTRLWRLHLAGRFLRLVDLATRAEFSDRELFVLLRDALQMANTIPILQMGAVRDAFVLQLLARAGYGSELEACVQCRGDELKAFSVFHGGTICQACVREDQYALSFSTSELEALRLHASVPLAATALLPQRDLSRFTQPLLRYRLETPLWFPVLAT